MKDPGKIVFLLSFFVLITVGTTPTDWHFSGKPFVFYYLYAPPLAITHATEK
jgi:hypothetical protein